MSTLMQTTLRLKVDYEKTVEAMVTAGNYGYANSNITDGNFPASGKGTEEIEAVLVGFGCWMGSEEVIARVGDYGLSIVERRLPRLLTIGIQYPDEQRKGPIVDLGSVWRDPHGGRCVPYLDGFSGERELRLSWFGDGWPDDCRFLAVRK